MVAWNGWFTKRKKVEPKTETIRSLSGYESKPDRESNFFLRGGLA
jgi:hypothetical protein